MEKVRKRKVKSKKTVSKEKMVFEDLVHSEEELQVKNKIRKRKVTSSQTKGTSIKKNESITKYPRIRMRKLHCKISIYDDILPVSDEEERELDRQVEASDNFSMGLIILLLIVCFVVGIGFGYLLYRLAINSSAVIVTYHFFH